MSFWTSEAGDVTGSFEDAFTKEFKRVPNGTKEIAKIDHFRIKEYNGGKNYEIQWTLIQGDFKGAVVFQKIHAFDADPKKRLRALNMMKLIFDMFGFKPQHDGAPGNGELAYFNGKQAGIKVREYCIPKDDKSGYILGNFIGEVHPVAGFTREAGVAMNSPEPKRYEPSIAQYSQSNNDVDEDLPF